MKIYKKYNNNVVQTFDDNSQEMIVIGSGIAFNKEKGSWIEEQKIEKQFVLNDNTQYNLISKLLKEIPVEHFETSEKIISFAEKILKTVLTPSIHVVLADHISFSIERFRSGMLLRNPLLNEIKLFYKDEYVIGLYALDLIKKDFYIELPEEEAGIIVMHIVDAMYNQEDLSVSKISKIINEIIKIVKYKLHIKVEEDEINWSRFLTHLKFFTQRIVSHKSIEYLDDDFKYKFFESYPKAYEDSKVIASFVEENYKYEVSEEEILYLAIHLQRLIRES